MGFKLTVLIPAFQIISIFISITDMGNRRAKIQFFKNFPFVLSGTSYLRILDLHPPLKIVQNSKLYYNYHIEVRLGGWGTEGPKAPTLGQYVNACATFPLGCGSIRLVLRLG